MENERDAFQSRKRHQQSQALQRAAFQLRCGLDLDAVLTGGEEKRQAARRKIRRLLQRERLKGRRGDYSYDINWQIALRQVLAIL